MKLDIEACRACADTRLGGVGAGRSPMLTRWKEMVFGRFGSRRTCGSILHLDWNSIHPGSFTMLNPVFCIHPIAEVREVR